MMADLPDHDGPPLGPYHQAADPYHKHGWQPFPVVGKAARIPKGITGHHGGRIDRYQVVDWMMARPDDNIALRLDGVIGIDVDAYEKDGTTKQGDTTLALAEQGWGPLPATWRSTSRGESNPSGIRFYRVPPGDINLDTIIKLPDENGELFGDIEIIQFHHRYAIVWPSVHPDTRNTYRWYTPDGLRAVLGLIPTATDLPWLPARWLEALTLRTPQGDPRPHTPAVPQEAPEGQWHDKVAARYREGQRAITGPAGSRHDNTMKIVAQLARDESRGRAGATTALRLLRDRFTIAIDSDSRDAAAEYDSMLGHARQLVATTTTTEVDLDVVAEVFGHLPLVELPPATAPPGNLPDWFWAARPELGHIRQAAWSRLLSPDAVFAVVLARVAAATHPAICLPSIIGAPASLACYAALTGPPGTGKSTSIAAAADLLPLHGYPKVAQGGQLGSGEGLIELYIREKEVKDDDGKKKTVRTHTMHGAFVTLDEGAALTELGQRKGSTVLAILRSMWTGGPIGQSNASKETTRTLRGGGYTLGFVIGIQPSLAGALLSDDAAGTPQRFLWARTTDPAIPEAPVLWPGRLPWSPPTRRGEFGAELDIDPGIAREIRCAALARNRGQIVIDALDAHADLLRLKVAGLLAVLNGRQDVTGDDWELARTVVGISVAVRSDVVDTVRAEAEQRAEDADRRAARRALATAAATTAHEETRVERTLDLVARKAVKAIAKAGQGKRRDITLAFSSRDRKLVSVDDVANHAVAMGWLVAGADGVFLPGTVPHD